MKEIRAVYAGCVYTFDSIEKYEAMAEDFAIEGKWLQLLDDSEPEDLGEEE